MSRSGAPLMPEIGVIALVPEKWAAPVRARHQIMPRLARYFNVVWMEPPDGWRECWFGSRPEYVAPTPPPDVPGFSIYDPCPQAPLFYKPRFVAEFASRWRLESARRILKRRGARKIVLYLWRPEFDAALDQLSHDLSLYHIVDEYNFSETELPNDNRETRLITRVNQVVVHSPGLLEKKGGLNPATTLIPNGVDYAAFATPRDEPADMRAIPHPRVGYVGVIKKELDLQLLLTLCRRHTDWSWVFVGPIGYVGDRGALIDALRACPNAYFLGEKPIAELPAYTQHIDVGLLCYHHTAFNDYIFPLKLHEYLAAGCAVVGTPIVTLKQFGHVIRLATSETEWSTALNQVLAPDARSPEQVEVRRAVAREFDWNRIADSVARVIAGGLGPEYEVRLKELQSHTPRAA